MRPGDSVHPLQGNNSKRQDGRETGENINIDASMDTRQCRCIYVGYDVKRNREHSNQQISNSQTYQQNMSTFAKFQFDKYPDSEGITKGDQCS